jgi:AraC-like DNA-binding protein
MHELLDSVVLLAAAQGGALAVALAAREKNRLANRILAALIGALSLMLLLGVLEKLWGFTSAPHLLGLGAPLPFLFAPLLYLYVVALTRPASRVDPRWLVHAIPFGANLVWWSLSFLLQSGSQKLAIVQGFNAGVIPAPPAMRLFEVLQLVQAIAYLVASWLALRAYARRIEGYFSDLARIDLRWLVALVATHAVVWGIVGLSLLPRMAGLAPASLRGFSEAIRMGSVLVVFLTGYASLWQPELLDKARAAQAAQPPLRYRRNRLEDEEAAALARKITAQLAQRKLYRDAGLTLQALADAVGATPHMLSQVLNVHLGKSFFVLVNTYRAEELMAALADPRQGGRGVLELALDAGFNSKSTLNSFFKRHTGVTPTEFRQRRKAARNPQISTG